MTTKTPGLVTEFRDFIMRGNVVDLAVGLVAGVVFGAVVQSLLSDIVLQILAAIVGQPSFNGLSFGLNGTEIYYGRFLTAVINFLLTMLAVFLVIVKPINALTLRMATPAEPGEPTIRECSDYLSEVPAAAKRCCYCAVALTPLV